MLTSSLKVFVLKCKPEEIYSLLQQTSSGHLRNCTFCRFNVGLSLLIRQHRRWHRGLASTDRRTKDHSLTVNLSHCVSFRLVKIKEHIIVKTFSNTSLSKMLSLRLNLRYI